MPRFILQLLICLFCVSHSGSIVAKDNDSLTRLLTADQARAWQGVGRLNLAGRGTCTGALIAPDRVLTAAHCVVDNRTKRVFKPSQITFLPGWRLGRASAYRNAKRVVVHRGYQQQNVHFDGKTNRETVATDIALIELDRAVDSNAAIPFSIQDQPRRGQELTVVSYAKGRNEVPSLEQGCRVLQRDRRVLMASCDVDFGASGAPIFVMDEGVPKVASVVSAMGESRGRKVMLGVALGAPLQELIGQLEYSDGVFQGKKPGGSLAEQLGRTKN